VVVNLYMWPKIGITLLIFACLSVWVLVSADQCTFVPNTSNGAWVGTVSE